MYEIFKVGALPGSNAYLLVTEEKAALIDSGYAFCADRMIEKIRERLGDRPLDYVLLTHSHYDHASGSVYCREAWRDVKVVASGYAGNVFQRPSAIAVIRSMNDNAAKLWKAGAYDDRLDSLSVDATVGEGSVIGLGGVNLKVWETPGHTKCSISFYSGEEGLLIACETMGTMSPDGTVVPCYLVGYDMTVRAIQRAIAHGPRHVLVPHFGLVSGEEARRFLREALRQATETRERVLEGYSRGKTAEELVQDMKRWFYTGEYARLQPEAAFVLNAGYTVRMLVREGLGVSDAR